MPVKTKIIKIGNSKGVRIPRALIEEANLGDEVELEVQEGKVVIKPASQARAGWEEDFKRMAEAGEAKLLWPEFPNNWDEEEWEW